VEINLKKEAILLFVISSMGKECNPTLIKPLLAYEKVSSKAVYSKYLIFLAIPNAFKFDCFHFNLLLIKKSLFK